MNTIQNIDKNTKFTIISINSDDSSKQKLFSMGIHLKDNYIKVAGKSKSAVIIQNLSINSTQIAISKDLASNIVVKVL